MTILLPILVILFFSLQIFLHIFFHKHLLKKTIEKEIKPYLAKKELILTGYQDLGISSTGDFKEREFTLMVNTNGNMTSTVYAYLFYNSNGVDKKVTARIDSTLWFITRVTYSDQL